MRSDSGSGRCLGGKKPPVPTEENSGRGVSVDINRAQKMILFFCSGHGTPSCPVATDNVPVTHEEYAYCIHN